MNKALKHIEVAYNDFAQILNYRLPELLEDSLKAESIITEIYDCMERVYGLILSLENEG